MEQIATQPFTASTKSCEESSEEEVDYKEGLQVAYNNPFKDCIRQNKIPKLLQEKEVLLIELDEAKRLIGNNKEENAFFFQKTKKYGEKIEYSKSLLKMFLSENLNQLFCSQKTSYDKSGLGYISEGFSIPSIYSPPQGLKEECPSKPCV